MRLGIPLDVLRCSLDFPYLFYPLLILGRWVSPKEVTCDQDKRERYHYLSWDCQQTVYFLKDATSGHAQFHLLRVDNSGSALDQFHLHKCGQELLALTSEHKDTAREIQARKSPAPKPCSRRKKTPHSDRSA